MWHLIENYHKGDYRVWALLPPPHLEKEEEKAIRQAKFLQCRNWRRGWWKFDSNSEEGHFGGVLCRYPVLGGDDAIDKGNLWWEVQGAAT